MEISRKIGVAAVSFAGQSGTVFIFVDRLDGVSISGVRERHDYGSRRLKSPAIGVRAVEGLRGSKDLSCLHRGR